MRTEAETASAAFVREEDGTVLLALLRTEDCTVLAVFAGLFAGLSDLAAVVALCMLAQPRPCPAHTPT